MNAGKCNIEIVRNEGGQPLLIKDVGPWDKFMTVTNDVEGVIASLREAAILTPGRRLYYIDSCDQLDELLVDMSGNFIGFKPGPPGAPYGDLDELVDQERERLALEERELDDHWHPYHDDRDSDAPGGDHE